MQLKLAEKTCEKTKLFFSKRRLMLITEKSGETETWANFVGA